MKNEIVTIVQDVSYLPGAPTPVHNLQFNDSFLGRVINGTITTSWFIPQTIDAFGFEFDHPALHALPFYSSSSGCFGNQLVAIFDLKDVFQAILNCLIVVDALHELPTCELR